MQYNNTLYVISSLGRSGSSLLDNSIRESDLKNNRNNYFWKTHYNPLEILNTHITNKKNIKNIFIFRDPIEIVLSLLNIYRDNRKEYGVEGKKFIYSHCQNMRRDWNEPVGVVARNFDKLIIEEDILKLEQMFDSFVENHRFTTVMINYKKLWENKSKLESYLDTDLEFPPKVNKDKQPKFKEFITNDEYNTILTTYKSLSQKINNYPEFSIIEKKTLAEKKISKLKKGSDKILEDIINLNTPTQWEK